MHELWDNRIRLRLTSESVLVNRVSDYIRFFCSPTAREGSHETIPTVETQSRREEPGSGSDSDSHTHDSSCARIQCHADVYWPRVREVSYVFTQLTELRRCR